MLIHTFSFFFVLLLFAIYLCTFPLVHISTALLTTTLQSMNYSDLLLSICYLALTLPLFCSHIHFTLILPRYVYLIPYIYLILSFLLKVI
jgi:hypothetical protein